MAPVIPCSSTEFVGLKSGDGGGCFSHRHLSKNAVVACLQRALGACLQRALSLHQMRSINHLSV
jgi:hypothetical protein